MLLWTQEKKDAPPPKAAGPRVRDNPLVLNRNQFRNRKMTTSRAPSLHVDDYVAMQKAKTTPKGSG